jgi:hypothetical protein
MDRGNRKLHPDVDSDFEDLVKDLLTTEILSKNE